GIMITKYFLTNEEILKCRKACGMGEPQPGVVLSSVLFNQTQSTSNAQISREGVDYFVELPQEEEGPAQQKNEATHSISKEIENLLIHGISQTLSLKWSRRDPTQQKRTWALT
ncbi:GGDEF domain-containing protein, partial [Sesbania bispinosa]